MSLDHASALLALRNRAAELEVCTTGSTSISATPTGYARAAGSFVTDRLLPGMEITPSGFTNARNNERTIVTFVSALVLSTLDSRITEAAGTREISVGLPENIAYENIEFEPVAGRPYLEEDYVEGPGLILSFPPDGAIMEERGIYALNWYFLPGYGSQAIHKCKDALKALFAPGTVIGTGANAVEVTGDPGPSATQPEPDGEGWTVVSIDIPFIALTTNAVTA